MSWPKQRICWLSIYLSLLALCIQAAEVSKDATNTTLQPAGHIGNENYEVIDVAQTNQNSNQQLQTGQTTRIFTTADVDDEFWLKHLGEDFKYAVHLQVGDSDRYDGIYNMTEDVSNYDIQHDYRVKEIPVDGNENKKINAPQTQTETQTQILKQTQTLTKTEPYKTEDIKQTQLQTQTNTQNTDDSSVDHTPAIDVQIKETVDKKNKKMNEDEKNSEKVTPVENGFEQIFAIDHDDGMSLIKKLQSMKKFAEDQGKNPKIQNINIKFTPKQKTSQHNDTKLQGIDKEIPDPAIPQQTPTLAASPIVITLPQDEKAVHHLADENTPVVVKMPPVIYHHNPPYEQLAPESLVNTPSGHLQQDPNMSQHNQYTIPTHISPDFSSYNSPIASPQSPSIPLQEPQFPYFTSSMLEDAPTYRRESAFDAQVVTSLNAIPSHASKEQLQKTSGSIRFILRKPSAPYNGPSAHNQIPIEDSF